MIQIKRASCPQVLKGSPVNGTHYNKKQVVLALWRMQYEKCCYCESSIPGEGHAKAVEHFRPRSLFEELRNNWNNLLLACAQCNGKKSNKFPRDAHGKPLILDPSDDRIDPEEHIRFLVDLHDAGLGLVEAKEGSEEGSETINAVGLRSSYHVQERKDYFWETILSAYRNLARAKDKEQHNPDALDVERRHFSSLLSADHKYAAFARAFARHARLDERFQIVIPKGGELNS